jgi:FkbH-like protein
MEGLYWLPEDSEWSARLKRLPELGPLAAPEVFALARCRIDFLRTERLDRAAAKIPEMKAAATNHVRLAVLGASTLDHLLPAIRVGGLRRNMLIDTFLPEYGTYQQALMDPRSELWQFEPSAVLFTLDQWHALGGSSTDMTRSEADSLIETISERFRNNWRRVKESARAAVIQQTVLPLAPALMGENEHLLPGSRLNLALRLNERLRVLAAEEDVSILALDRHVATNGFDAWHDSGLWYRAKQEVKPSAAPLYGDFVARLLAARLGRSSKCLVLDLDNTLWSGVIGDDGLAGIVLGQGSAVGEAHHAVQEFARALALRGVILAVCSKNDESNAREPFSLHPQMLLRESDIACFVANWEDKATNIRRIASQLNIGIDSLVFVDDNPFERQLVRSELPMVAVPELPDEPALWPQCLADAGYFEALAVTAEDRDRTRLYQGNAARENLMSQATDVESYLRTLNMRLQWRHFDPVDLQRIVQLINKTNQFNLTTRRYVPAEVEAMMAAAGTVTLQLRLVDCFGDNGIIALIIGLPDAHDKETLIIDTWLMSCRVLGRRVEEASLNLLVQEAEKCGYRRIIGRYVKTEKNGMVKDHYAKLSFELISNEDDLRKEYVLNISDFGAAEVPMIFERV